MKLSKLKAISPVDGRYRNKVENLSPYFSEYGWIHYRVFIEIEYFIELAGLEIPGLNLEIKNLAPEIRKIHLNFNEEEAQKIKDIEKETNHDIKAVEYYLRKKFEEIGLEQHVEFIHFGLTSQDINNTAVPLLLKDFNEQAFWPALSEIRETLARLAKTWESVPMLARTHGQAASPTRLGKEIWVFVERLDKQIALLKELPQSAKFGGATGNFNAHALAYPQVDWVNFANVFLKRLGLDRSQTTTQIEHYDMLAAQLDNLQRIHTILIDLARDFWHYISIDYFKQKTIAGEVGSSAMPHKVNPIDFENAEGNLGLANALAQHLSQKLPISRLQRDLTDSTVLRNLGMPYAHSLIALQSLTKGLSKLELNPARLAQDLEDNWAVLAEAIQTILRREQYPHPYEALKQLTRGKGKINAQTLQTFIQNLDVNPTVKAELLALRPENYLGIPPQMS